LRGRELVVNVERGGGEIGEGGRRRRNTGGEGRCLVIY